MLHPSTLKMCSTLRLSGQAYLNWNRQVSTLPPNPSRPPVLSTSHLGLFPQSWRSDKPEVEESDSPIPYPSSGPICTGHRENNHLWLVVTGVFGPLRRVGRPAPVPAPPCAEVTNMRSWPCWEAAPSGKSGKWGWPRPLWGHHRWRNTQRQCLCMGESGVLFFWGGLCVFFVFFGEVVCFFFVCVWFFVEYLFFHKEEEQGEDAEEEY